MKEKHMKPVDLYVHLTREVLNYLEINKEREDGDDVVKEVAEGVGMFVAHIKHDYNRTMNLLVNEAIIHYEEECIKDKNKKTPLRIIK